MAITKSLIEILFAFPGVQRQVVPARNPGRESSLVLFFLLPNGTANELDSRTNDELFHLALKHGHSYKAIKMLSMKISESIRGSPKPTYSWNTVPEYDHNTVESFSGGQMAGWPSRQNKRWTMTITKAPSHLPWQSQASCGQRDRIERRICVASSTRNKQQQ